MLEIKLEIVCLKNNTKQQCICTLSTVAHLYRTSSLEAYGYQGQTSICCRGKHCFHNNKNEICYLSIYHLFIYYIPLVYFQISALSESVV